MQLRLKIPTLIAAIKQPAASPTNGTDGSSFRVRAAENRWLYAQGVPLTSERLGPILSRDTDEM